MTYDSRLSAVLLCEHSPCVHSDWVEFARGPFHERFFHCNSNLMEFQYALIQVIVKWLLQKFAHGTAVQLLWLAQNFVLIYCTMDINRNLFSVKFELQWKNRLWNGPQIELEVFTRAKRSRNLHDLHCKISIFWVWMNCDIVMKHIGGYDYAPS